MKTTILRLSSIGLATLGMGIGIAAASTASISNTGPSSTNNATISNDNSASITNNNNLSCQEYPSFLFVEQEFCGVANLNLQTATSGDATVDSNTNAGSARSGDADNHASSSTTISVTNGSGVPAGFFSGSDNVSINTTGPSSSNDASVTNNNSWTVDNSNDVSVANLNEQSAGSGSGSVTSNTNAGSASTGSAGNTSSANTNVSIHN